MKYTLTTKMKPRTDTGLAFTRMYSLKHKVSVPSALGRTRALSGALDRAAQCQIKQQTNKTISKYKLL